jgi:phosphatidylinositol alpha-1,6-mannosyltransferase
VHHLLVTNDFPPKHGGIQSYLWELWRRLPAGTATVLTTPFDGADGWDRAQPFRVVRDRARVLLPTRALRQRIDSLAADVGADLVVLDPLLPVGHIGPSLARPYGVVVHGAEVTVPGRLPVSAALTRRVLRGARIVIAAGGYPGAVATRVAKRPLPIVVVPPGVDGARFVPLDDSARADVRRRYGLPVHGRVLIALSRIVPRKGIDVVIRATARLAASRPDLVLAVGGDGRDRTRLARIAHASSAPVRFLGRVPDDDLPGVFACADVFAMLCRNRWAGLEQEGFGIVFLEAAAAGVAQVAGQSGGAAEAVVDGVTGVVVEDPSDLDAVEAAIAGLIDDPVQRGAMAAAGRARALADFSYDGLAARLDAALQGWRSEPA